MTDTSIIITIIVFVYLTISNRKEELDKAGFSKAQFVLVWKYIFFA